MCKINEVKIKSTTGEYFAVKNTEQQKSRIIKILDDNKQKDDTIKMVFGVYKDGAPTISSANEEEGKAYAYRVLGLTPEIGMRK